ncbi:phosphoribosylanthranilate isomerase [Pseudobacter ginsenosidimutans]|uniref:N-(5'-phosphoribosyl)anthranilate isomerase n=1 Tax=Pseudobacter ginsenosidimutans TaxID=661488 RepID=A0A4Q7MFE1_9BACT|nr:phosphoribosylanthranilate isomerase [Pseudobacter ginsenosidimutans]QEC45362.1 phosphoribosylanthranilate isomerase [Pseudobacter ginsenosidimutans]RZS66886.1 phosphoribosylanthranilate isomerase [Pseudobacter ginsenosidimutans]
MRVKVCGMTQPEQVAQLADMGVSFAGFIFYPKSPRYVFKHMTTTQIRKENNINKVGVFVNAPIEEVLHMVDECRLHLVQLHGDENPKYCEKIADYVSVVKAFRLSDNDSVEWMIRPYMDCCDMFMFDTMGAGYGGTGKKFDWSVLKDTIIGKPFFLSGGIEPGDEAQLREFEKEPAAKALFAIDINSKFETNPGYKDMEKVRGFVNNMK